MQQKVSIKHIILIAGAYAANVIGSGFATGQELLQFFVYYGLGGIGACLIAMLLFSWFGAECLKRNSIIKLAHATKIYRFYCGKYLGIFFEWFAPLFLFGVFAIMVSGSGATVEQQFGIDPLIGRIGMAAICLITVSMGLNKLADLLGNIGPAIIVVTLFVGVYSIFYADNSFSVGVEKVQAMLDHAVISQNSPNWAISGVQYAIFNIIVVMVFLSGIGAQEKFNKKELIYGGILGGVGLMLAAFVMYVSIVLNVDPLIVESGKFAQVPSLILANSISPIIGKIYLIILVCGIYTTAAPLLWQVVNKFVIDSHKFFKPLVAIIAILGLFAGMLPFDKLISVLYPLSGYVGIAIVICMIYKQIIYSKNPNKALEDAKKYND